jgi:hypothetical protein
VTMTVNKRASRNTTKSANVNDMELSSIWIFFIDEHQYYY